MTQASNLNLFLERIMNINVLHMGGASAGIIGSASAVSDIVNNLKRSSVAFASEYSKSDSNNVELERLSDEIAGFLQTLQLMYVLSEGEANKLTDELQIFMEEVSA
jgi:hypothetical protein